MKWNYIVGDRRTGKTTVLIQGLSLFAQTHPNSRCLYLAPTSLMLNYSFRDFDLYLESKKIKHRQLNHQIVLKNNAKISFVNSVDHLYGLTIDAIAIDEAEFIDDISIIINKLTPLFGSDAIGWVSMGLGSAKHI